MLDVEGQINGHRIRAEQTDCDIKAVVIKLVFPIFEEI